jgi:hypothetical protein
MRQALVTLLLVLGWTTPAFSGVQYRVLDQPSADLYFGHVSRCDLRGDALDPQIVRGDVREPASLNSPLTPGDVLATPAGRRCEVEFDAGTVAWVDGDSRLRLETVLAPSLTSGRKLTNLILEAGRVRVSYRQYGSSEVFQLLTPGAAVKLAEAAVVEVTAEAAESAIAALEGRASVLYGPTEQATRRVDVKAGRSLRVLADHRVREGVYEPGSDDFARRGGARERERLSDPGSGRPLPATLRSLPPSVVDFAHRLSRTHGEWVWTGTKEHAWRPHLNQDPSWRPYLRGRFTLVRGAPFWVADEEWGWVPYHLGLWYRDPGPAGFGCRDRSSPGPG